MNKSHDYRALEREFVTTDISLRELRRRHNITAHSLVIVQAKKHKWEEKCEQCRAKADEEFMSRHAARQAARVAEVRDKAIDVIEEALDKFREDMRATEKRRIDGQWVEVPVMRLMPSDIAVLLDRLQVLFERPTHISEGRDLTVRTELPIDVLGATALLEWRRLDRVGVLGHGTREDEALDGGELILIDRQEQRQVALVSVDTGQLEDVAIELGGGVRVSP